MNKIVTLAAALSMVASVGFAGGVKDAKLQYIAPAPTVPSSLPNASPLLLLLVGGSAVVLVGAVLGNSGNASPNAN